MFLSNSGSSSIPLKEDEERDIIRMFRSVPMIQIALKQFMAMTLAKPFKFSIPRLSLESNEDMEKLVTTFWMPWLRECHVYAKIYGVVPYWIEKKKNAHPIPRCPPLGSGQIKINFDIKTRSIVYEFYWKSFGTFKGSTEPDKKMLWFITEDKPLPDGSFMSPLSTLLGMFRDLLILEEALNIYGRNAPRPVHILEFDPRGEGRAGMDTNFKLFAPQFQAAAGIAEKQLEQLKNQEIMNKIRDTYEQLHQIQMENEKTTQRVTWSENPLKSLEEMNAGFPNRTVILRPNWKYVKASEPKAPTSEYFKMLEEFDIQCAAIMDFTVELLKPSGSARSQNLESARKFENDRVNEKTALFTIWAQTALSLAYYDEFDEPMRKHRDKGMHPELDVKVDMSVTTANSYDTYKQMCHDGIIDQKTFAMEALKNANMPMEFMKLHDPHDIELEKIKRQKRDGDSAK